MKNLIVSILAMAFMASAVASEKSPFTKIDFGLVFGWGDFIKVENPDYLAEGKTHYLIEVNGKEYKEIIAEVKALHGGDYKCKLAEHFVETMTEIGVVIEETVDLKVYIFDGGHQVIDVNDVPVTEDNLFYIQTEDSFCE